MDVALSQTAPSGSTTDPGSAQYTAPASTLAASSASPAAQPASTPSSDAKGQLPAGPLQPFTGAVLTVFAGQNVEVCFRVAHDPNEIVIVYRNAQTGEIINQVPSESILRLAEFFQSQAIGALLDKGA